MRGGYRTVDRIKECNCATGRSGAEAGGGSGLWRAEGVEWERRVSGAGAGV